MRGRRREIKEKSGIGREVRGKRKEKKRKSGDRKGSGREEERTEEKEWG